MRRSPAAMAIAMALALGACDTAEPLPFETVGDHSAAELDLMRRAFDVVRAECPPLAREGNLERVAATLGPPLDPDRRVRYGWSQEVRFIVAIKGWPHADAMGAAGQTVFIGAGGGAEPGIIASGAARNLCRFETARDDDAHRPVPALAFLGG